MTAHTATSDTGPAPPASTSDAIRVPQPRTDGDGDSLLNLELAYTAQGTAVLNVRGEVDLCSTPRFRELLENRLRSELRLLVLDLSEVGFLSIEGAQMLARAAVFAQYHETELRIVTGDSRPVHRVFLATGLDRELPLRHS